MKLGLIYKQLWIVGVYVSLAGCGASSNIWGVTTPPSHREGFYAALGLARAYYDEGQLDQAYHWATIAHEKNIHSEEAAILFGFVALGKAGLEPFRLAAKMSDQGEDEEGRGDDGAETQSEDQGAEDQGAAAPSEEDGNSTGSVLASMSEVLGITSEDLALMGDLDASDPDLPLLIPKCAEDARSLVKTLALADQAVRAICPFIEEGAKVEGELRHACEPFEGHRTQRAKGLFLWALAHLTDAMAFNGVLNATSQQGGEGKSNLELRVEKLQQIEVSDPSQIPVFIDEIRDLENTVSKIMPLGTCSEQSPTTQLRATLNDMLAATVAFQLLPGIPPEVTQSLQSSMARINQVSGGADDVTGRLAALRSDMTRSLSNKLSSKIDAIAAQTDLDPEKREQLCDAYASFSGADLSQILDSQGLTQVDGVEKDDGGESALPAPKICSEGS